MIEGIWHYTRPPETSASALVHPRTSDKDADFFTLNSLEETFGPRILSGLSECQYTDLGTHRPKLIYIRETAVLPSSIRAMNQVG